MGERIFVEDGFAREIGKGHFSGGDEPKTIRRFDFPHLTSLPQEVDDLLSSRSGGRRELIFGKLRQLRRTEHCLVTNKQRWIHFGVAMLVRVQVEHELPERALEPCETFFQDDEARAGKLRRGLEIHLAQRFAEIEVLLGRKAVAALRTEMMMLHIVVQILAVRHFGRRKRQVRNLRKRVLELLGELLLLRFQRRYRGLQFRDLGQKLLRRRFLVALLRRANLLGSRVAPGERRLRLLDGGAPALVELDQPFRLAGKPTPRQPLVEGVGVVANPFDVVHFSDTLWPIRPADPLGSIRSSKSPR